MHERARTTSCLPQAAGPACSWGGTSFEREREGVRLGAASVTWCGPRGHSRRRNEQVKEKRCARRRSNGGQGLRLLASIGSHAEWSSWRLQRASPHIQRQLRDHWNERELKRGDEFGNRREAPLEARRTRGRDVKATFRSNTSAGGPRKRGRVRRTRKTTETARPRGGCSPCTALCSRCARWPLPEQCPAQPLPALSPRRSARPRSSSLRPLLSRRKRATPRLSTSRSSPRCVDEAYTLREGRAEPPVDRGELTLPSSAGRRFHRTARQEGVR